MKTNDACSAGTAPYISRPSSVNVPVLSKQKTSMAPHTFIYGGLMQNTLERRNRFCANTMPIVIAAGNAGGITIVTRSSVRTMILNTPLPR